MLNLLIFKQGFYILLLVFILESIKQNMYVISYFVFEITIHIYLSNFSNDLIVFFLLYKHHLYPIAS
jgi:hypothetical protein